MAKDPQKQGWGTWEELLLAFAVKRHGFKNWDSVAWEIQSKSSLPRAQTTALNCQQKYHDLNLRFANRPPYSLPNNEQIRPQAITAAVEEETINIPWLEDLRKLRVAELKQEVNRYDVSILSLQLKVKRLEEDRGKSSEAGDENLAKADLKRQESETDGNKRTSLSVSDPNEESDRDNRSVYESISTGSKGEATAELKDEGCSEQDPVASCSNWQESPSSLGMERKREIGARDHSNKNGVLPENMVESEEWEMLTLVDEENFPDVRSRERPVAGGRSLRRIDSNHTKDASSPSKKQTRRGNRSKVGSADDKYGTRLTGRKTEGVALAIKESAAKKNSPVVMKNKTKGSTTRNGSVELKKKNSRGSSVTRRGGSNHGMVESKRKTCSGKKSEKKEDKERNNQPRRSVGRPSKKETKMNKILGKHRRDGEEKDLAKRPRTRPRR